MNLIEAFARSLEKSLAADSTSSERDYEPITAAPAEPDTLRQNKRVAKRCSPPARTEQVNFEDLFDARSNLLQTLIAYLETENPGYMLVINGLPGFGKTTTGVKLAHWVHRERSERVLYAGPRHNFFDDILEASAKQGEHPWLWFEWLPRQHNMPDPTKDTCRYATDINEFIRRGYRARHFCTKICGEQYMENKCPFLAQAQNQSPLIYAQHQHVTRGNPLAKECVLLIGDENPMMSFQNKMVLTSDDIHFYNLAPTSDLGLLIDEIKGMLVKKESRSGFDLWSALDMDWVLETLKPYDSKKINEMTRPRYDKADEVHKLGYNILPILVPLMRREVEAAIAQRDAMKTGRHNSNIRSEFIERIVIKDGKLTIKGRLNKSKELPTHIIWCDATGDPAIYEELFEMPVRVIKPNLKLSCYIIQNPDRSNAKGSLMRYIVADPEDRADTEIETTDRAKNLRLQIEEIVAQGGFKNPLIVCPKALVEYLGAHTYFYGNRGTNAYEDCDVVIIAGTPMPPLEQIEEIAEFIWYNRMQRFDNTWIVVDRKYDFVDTDGMGWEIPINEYSDRHLNAILYQLREAEIVQSVHRGRILLNDKPVYLLTSLPVPGLPPNELMTTRQLMNAPEGVHVFKWREAIDFVEMIAAERGSVGLSDLTSGLGISKETAIKYMNALVESGEWETRIFPSGKPGRPSRSIARTAVLE